MGQRVGASLAGPELGLEGGGSGAEAGPHRDRDRDLSDHDLTVTETGDTWTGPRRPGWGQLRPGPRPTCDPAPARRKVGSGGRVLWRLLPSPRPAQAHAGRGHPQPAPPSTHLEAVKMCLALVHAALMGLSWPLTSPTGVKPSTFQTLMTPARQALSSMGRPGTKARAHTQSLWALGTCCGRGSG